MLPRSTQRCAGAATAEGLTKWGSSASDLIGQTNRVDNSNSCRKRRNGIAINGIEVEAHVREVAAALGVADFVYLPAITHKGTAVREVSDGLLSCGQGTVILQVKAREPAAAANDDAEGSKRWLQKQYGAAVRQGQGTRRTIEQHRASGMPVNVIPARALGFPAAEHGAFSLPLDIDPSGWPILVVLAHPLARGVTVPIEDGVLAITLDDWRILNRRVRSVNGLVRYVNRLIDAALPAGNPVMLGHEAERFAALAHADDVAPGDWGTSVPWFSSAISQQDELGIEFYRELLHSVWRGNAHGPALGPAACRLILDHLDDAPAVMQANVGNWIYVKRQQLDATGHRQSGVVVLDQRLLLYACDNEVNEPNAEAWKSELINLAATRAAEWREQRGTGTNAVCVGVREMAQGVEYTHILINDQFAQQIPREVRAAIESHYGVPNLRARTLRDN